MEAHTLFRTLEGLVWTFLTYSAFRLRMVAKYRLVFVMILGSMIFSIGLWVLSTQLGRAGLTYSMTWVVAQVASEGIPAAALCRFHDEALSKAADSR